MNKQRKNVMILLIILTLGISIIGAMSYFIDKSTKQSTLKFADIKTEIVETFENNIKTNVYVHNNGSADAYVRIKILIYYEDMNGNILLERPIENTDYTINFANDFNENWFENDDCYYYKRVLNAGDNTEQLIEELRDLKPDDEKQLVVDILAQTIQTEPSEAVETAWLVRIQENKEIVK